MFEFLVKKSATCKDDLLSGLTVALALVPEAVAFSFVAGVHPLVGLYAAFIVGLITAAIGGRRGMISGATGALAVVMVALVAKHGVEYLFATVVLMGIFQILAGIFRLGNIHVGCVTAYSASASRSSGSICGIRGSSGRGSAQWTEKRTIELVTTIAFLTTGIFLQQ